MKKIVIIVVALIKKRGKYLLTKRYDPRRPIVHETWQLVGGGLRHSESIINCLHREVKEEIGVDVQVVSFIPFIHDKFIKEEDWHGIAIGFLCQLKKSSISLKLNREATEYGWFTVEQALNLKLHPGAEEFLKTASKINL